MAKDIIVTEGSQLKIIRNVSSLATYLPGETGDQAWWIPEDEVRLITKTIVEDGTYLASKEIGSPYGYSEVTVSGAGNQVIGTTGIKNVTENGVYYANQDEKGPFYGYSKVVVNVTGKSGSGGSSGGSGGKPTSGTVGKDTDGDDAMVVVDPDTGELEIEKIPSYIVVTTEPYNPYVIYNNGQQITKDGMVVKAYTENGDEWGTVPIEEVTIDPTVAVYDASTDYRSGEASYDGSTISYTLNGYSWETVSSSETAETISYLDFHPEPSAYTVPVLTNGLKSFYAFSLDASLTANTDITSIVTYNTGNERKSSFTNSGPVNSSYYQIDGLQKTYYWGQCQYTDEDSPFTHTDLSTDSIARILFEGEKTPIRAGSVQTITVSWPRPGDLKELTTTFEIIVAPPYSVDDNSFQDGGG